MQLSLLDVDGKQSGGTATCDWIDVARISPHPDNPRLFIREEVVSAIADGIKDKGFDPCYAVLVRPHGDGYQMISGHHRLEGCKRADVTHIAAWVREMDDDEAFLELVRGNNQGELKPLEIGLHALQYIQTSSGGRGQKGGLSEYARQIGKESSRQHLTSYRAAAEVFKSLNLSNVGQVLDRANHLAAIHKAPSSEWTWLVQLLLASKWSVKQTESAVKAIAGLAVDPRLNDWLRPEQYKKQAVKEASQGQASDIVSRVSRWSKTAVESLESLDDSRPAWLFSNGGEPYREIISPKALFLERLQGIGTPSDKKILNVKSQVLAYLDELDREYAHWEEQQRDANAAQRAAEAEERRIAQLKERYTPEGINADLREVEIEKGTIDAVITDPPYLLSNGGFTLRSGKEAPVDKNFEDSEQDAIAPEEWLPIVADWLKPGGVLIATCTLHIYHRLWNTAQACGFDVAREQAIWHKRNSPPQLSPDRLQPDFEYIFIAFKPGEKYYFGYEDYRQSYGSQPSRVFDIPQCSGKERLGWHDTQKPIELSNKLITLYCPEDGIVLDPFAGSGTFVASAKGLKRRAVWIEQDAGHFSKAENRIAIAPFAWEMGS